MSQQLIDLTADCSPGCSHQHQLEVKPAKRGRTRKRKEPADDGAEPTASTQKAKKAAPEKRIAFSGKAVRYSKAPPAPTRERIQRALPGSGHRMFLLTRKTLQQAGSEAGAAEEFEILGATGNVYKVTVSKSPTCTCPDSTRRGDLCKHYLYVMIRVLRLAQDDHLVWQRGLLTTEVDEVLSGQHSQRGTDADVMAERAILEAHRRLCGTTEAASAPASTSAAAGLAPGQRNIEGDCPICYDTIDAAQKDTIIFCKSCGNNVHKECFQRWSAAKQGVGVTCVWCRASWVSDTPKAAVGEFVNLRDHSSAHRHADTSLGALYGSNAIWIGAHAGHHSMRQAARMAHAASGRV